MEHIFTSKTRDFTTYCETAFAHYKNRYYADSLTNMRKAGEAVCKLILIFKYNEKTALSKIGHKSFNDLIDVIEKENLSPHTIIHSLKGLQIHGNIAAHDKRVMESQAHTAIRVLSFIITWVFEDFLHSATPSVLKKEIGQMLINSTSDSGEKLKAELMLLKKEKEEREKHLITLQERDALEKEKNQKLTDDLKISEKRNKDLEEKHEQFRLLELKQSEIVKKPEEIIQDTYLPIEKRKYSIFFKPGAILTSLAIIVTLTYLFKDYFATSVQNSEILSEGIQPLQKEEFKVIIFPFTILQDNPNIQIKFEEALESRIKQKIIEHQLPLRISFNPSFIKSSLSTQEAIAEGTKEKANLVVFGELYEHSATDSAQVNFKLAIINTEFPYNDETGIRSFSRLTDSSAINIMREAEFYIEGCLAAHYLNKNKFSDALALLYKLKPISRNQIYVYYYMLATCHNAQKNYNTAIHELTKLLAWDSSYSQPFFFIAECYASMGKYHEAGLFYEKGLKIEPNNLNYLLNYASLVSADNSKANMYKAREMVLRALEYDSTSARAWCMLGNWEYAMKNPAGARDNYLQCIKHDSSFTLAKKTLAKLLAFDFQEPEKAEKILSDILKKDSADTEALFTLGNIYYNTRIKDSKKAEYLLNKCKQYQSGDNYQTEFGLGMNAFNSGEIQKAQKHLIKAYSLDSSSIQLCTYIGQTFYLSNQMEKSFPYLMRAYVLDSLNFMNNTNLGYYYYTTPQHINYDKAVYYFEKALTTNPYDTLSLEYLATMYFAKGNFAKAKELFTKLISFVPANKAANQHLGWMLEQEGKYAQAIPLIRKTLEYYPNDFYSSYKLAFSLVMVDKNKYLKEALNHAKRAVELNRESADAMVVLSQLYFFNNDTRKAHELYNRAVEINPAVADIVIEQAMGLKK